MKCKRIPRTTNTDLIDARLLTGRPAAVPDIKPRTYRVVLGRHHAADSRYFLYLLPPGVRPCTKPDYLLSDDFSGYHVSFREEVVLMLQCEHLVPFGPLAAGKRIAVTDPTAQERLIKTIQKIILAGHQTDAERVARLSGLLKILLVYVSRQYAARHTETDNPASDRILYRFKELLSYEPSGHKVLSDFASELSVSQNYLNVMIRKSWGYTASQLIQQNKIYRAKQAAISTHASMKEVAWSLGFHDMAHFSKFFRNGAGMTFTDFKKAFQTY
ncbi:helix-turn-helix transcriptional regulator [Dyadobacter sp. CY261]|uniref:helix-turn-helix domain-containing protein n=1 Tax=Dyadobacter sp. CY261 TaxID=2907203 RepID=UPI001F302F5C|nr:helix-turn-helix transcriptional regulator [Dyadobacter sp. CY261]MCF0069551.1 helix-turn-helix transcriptional regulator [Dyadobacter sp. CY261]